MRVAVITAYYRESEAILRRCLDSVRAQTVPCTHIVVADGGSARQPFMADVQHIELTQCHDDVGNTPRLIGAASAYAQGFDALCWLDADNWFDPTHVAALLDVSRTRNVSVVTAARRLCRPDGSVLGVCDECDGHGFTDSSCYFLMRDAMPLAINWGFDRQDRRLAPIGDRVFWGMVRDSCAETAHHPVPTVNYTTMYASHYLDRGEEPPSGAKVLVTAAGVVRAQPYRGPDTPQHAGAGVTC